MRLGLVGRILIAGGVVVAFLLVEFALFIGAVHGLRRDADRQRRAEQAIASVARYEKLVLDLETGQRGFVIAGDDRFLEPWTSAQEQLPAAARELAGLTSGAKQAAAVRTLTVAVDQYLELWSRPVVLLARIDHVAARQRVATGEGRRRIDGIRRQVERLTAIDRRVAERASASVAAEERHAVAAGVVGVIGTVALFLGIVGYFLRAAILPTRRIAEGTARVTHGELDARVPERGAGEVGQLAAAFNVMADSLQRSRDELEHLVNVNTIVLDSTVDGICLTDLDGNILLSNKPLRDFVRQLQLPTEGTVPERLLAVSDRFKDAGRYRAAIRRIASVPLEPTVDEFELVGSGRCFQGFTAPVEEHGELVGRVWTLREVTAERESDRLKDEFIATVSHELRTPLTSIVGFVEMLLDEDVGPVTEEQRRFLEIVERSSQRLMRQVGDLLFVARLDSAGLAIRLEEVQLQEVVAESVEQVAALASQKQIELTTEVAAVPPLQGDRERIAQAVANLLSNAVKFTPPDGRIVVRVGAERGSAFVEVEDTGIGIPEAERGRLFERFFRSSSATQEAVQGTGLGLAISKAIVDAHRGAISAEPGPGGVGTLFRLELPLDAGVPVP